MAASGKAPPEVDAALRARIKQFYQAHVDAKFRLADQVVAEESKDMFFASPKSKIEGFEISKITYSENFTKAEAVVATRTLWVHRGESLPVTLPNTSYWKLMDGQWFWHLSVTTEAMTPFGRMVYNSGVEPTSAVPAALPDPRVLAQQILSAVKADKDAIQLSSDRPATAAVSIHNGVGGPVTLKVEFDNGFPGLSATFDKTEVPGGGDAVVTFTCKPVDERPKPAVTARIHVQPTGQVIPIKISFTTPPGGRR
jgi:hypothetical protein